jgi:predicted TIM-barrel fold metal-dependent hydrolase
VTLDFVDTHVHFHDLRSRDLTYDWLRPGGDPAEAEVLGEYGAIRAERYRAEDFRQETRFSGVEAAVHVQAALGSRDPVAETAWLTEAHRRTGFPHAIIGHVDLASPDAIDTLNRHLEFPLFRGVRDLGLAEAYRDPRCDRSLAELDRHGLVLCDATELPRVDEAVALVARHGAVTYCVDHAMMPMRRTAEYFAEWRRCLDKVAALPNAVIKISGLGQVDHEWTVDSLRPWVLACIEAFGIDRAFFGTNWPVDRLYSSYGDLVSAYAEICVDFSPEERRALFSGNARRVFGIVQ